VQARTLMGTPFDQLVLREAPLGKLHLAMEAPRRFFLLLRCDAPDVHPVDGIPEIRADGTSCTTITVQKVNERGQPSQGTSDNDLLYLRTDYGTVFDAEVLIRYHFDYELVQIWRSEVHETPRHDPSARQPWQGFDGTTWAESVPRHVVPAQAEAGANSYAAVQSCRRPETRPHAVSSGYDPYRNSGFCALEVLKHVAG
jgi:hypothetical protein